MQDYHTRMDASSVLLVAILIEKSMPIFYAVTLTRQPTSLWICIYYTDTKPGHK